MTNIEQFSDRQLRPRLLAAYDGTVSPEETFHKQLDAIAQSGYSNLRSYANCCRSTYMAITCHLSVPSPEVVRSTATLAGGIAGTGETCGAVLGGLIAIGEAVGANARWDAQVDAKAIEAAKAFVRAFTDSFTSTRCHAIQRYVMGGLCCDDPSKVQSWIEAEGPRGCALVCAEAARIAARILLSGKANSDPDA